MSFLDIGENQYISYKLEGSGEAVVLLNGIMMTKEAWAFQRKALAEKHKILRYDFLGQGQSSKQSSGYSLAGHGVHLKRLLDHTEIGAAHLIGASYGGEVGLLFAANYPERVRSITVAGSVSELSPLLKAMGRSWMEAASIGDGEAFFRILLPYIYSNAFLSEKGLWLEERIKEFAGNVTAEWFKAFNGLMESFLELHFTHELKKVKAPCMIVAGKEDILKPPHFSHLMARHISNARLELMDTGHAIPLEDPITFNALLLDFISKN